MASEYNSRPRSPRPSPPGITSLSSAHVPPLTKCSPAIPSRHGSVGSEALAGAGRVRAGPMSGERRTVRTRDPIDKVIRLRTPREEWRSNRGAARFLAARGRAHRRRVVGARVRRPPRGAGAKRSSSPGLALTGLRGFSSFSGAACVRFRWPSRGAGAGARRRRTARPSPRGVADTPAIGRDDPGAQRGLGRAPRADAPPGRGRPAGRRPTCGSPATTPGPSACCAPRADCRPHLRPGPRRRVGHRGAAPARATATVASGPSFEAWAEPPAYTGRPTLYLPEGRAAGAGRGAPRHDRHPPGLRRRRAASSSPRASRAARRRGVRRSGERHRHRGPSRSRRSGAMALPRGGATLGAWTFLMEPDLEPDIDLDRDARAGPDRRDADRLRRVPTTTASSSARAEIALDLGGGRSPPTASPPSPRRASRSSRSTCRCPHIRRPRQRPRRDAGRGLLQAPLGRPAGHAAGPSAEDAIGQIGARDGLRRRCCRARRFYHPVAAALVEQRRDLLWTPANAPRVVQVLRAVTHRPEGLFDDERVRLSRRPASRSAASTPRRAGRTTAAPM